MIDLLDKIGHTSQGGLEHKFAAIMAMNGLLRLRVLCRV